jgi:pimeloyl-ACP methyl ester carboxylesterase
MKPLFAALSLLAVATVSFGQNVRQVRLTTADDVAIAAAYYRGANEQAPVIVLVHGAAQTRDAWLPFVPALQRQGYAVLTFDLRGHGQSNRKITARGPDLIDPRSFTERDYIAMTLDLNAVVDWLGEQAEINPKRIAIIGAGIGANLALRYAAENDDIAGVALISPGINYRGVRTDDAIKKYGPRPLRLFVCKGDLMAFESTKQLLQFRKDGGHASDDKELTVCSGELFGLELLKGAPEVTPLLLEWLRSVLTGAKPSTAPAPAPAPTPLREQ